MYKTSYKVSISINAVSAGMRQSLERRSIQIVLIVGYAQKIVRGIVVAAAKHRLVFRSVLRQPASKLKATYKEL